MKRFRKTVSLVIEGSVSGSSVEISIRPTEEITITDLCIDNGGGTECRRILLAVRCPDCARCIELVIDMVSELEARLEEYEYEEALRRWG